MTVPGVDEAIRDGQMYSVATRGSEGFVYKVVALNHPQQASSVFISDKKKGVNWILANLRTAQTALDDRSISNRLEVETMAADLREAADILLRYRAFERDIFNVDDLLRDVLRDDMFEGDFFYAHDVATASVVSRALLVCGKKDVVRVE